MKKFIFFLSILSFFASCKDPLPFYFDKPLGKVCDSFPEIIRGNYFSLDEGKLKEQIVRSDKYVIENDTIYKKIELSQQEFDTMNNEMKRILVDTLVHSIQNKSDSLLRDSLKLKDLNAVFDSFNTIKENPLIKMNTLRVEELVDMKGFDRYNMIFGYFHIGRTRIDLIGIDSAGKMSRVNLFTLSDKMKLTVLNGNYFINFFTSHGWEEMSLEPWRNKFICISALYITSYNEKSVTEKDFLNSVKDLYPGLKVVYNGQKQIAGVKAKANEKALLKLFDKSELKIYLIKN